MTKRIVLMVLIALNLGTIFFFSQQTGEKSGALSDGLSRQIEVRVPNYEAKNQGEKYMLHVVWRKQIRRLAHVALFLSLGILVSLLLWDYPFSWIRLLGTTIFGVLCSFSDEIHQLFVPGRTFQWGDIQNDLEGYFLGMIIGSLIVFFLYLWKNKRVRKLR